MDLVYILGTGSEWHNNEIKYSLRSVEKNLTHDKVFVVGEKCDWFSDKIIHIPAEDPYKEKLKNALHKLSIACNDKRISKDFILMNDDFFILKPITEIKPYYKCTLRESIDRHPTKAGYYYTSIEDTLKFLGTEDALDYSLHYPFVYNKAKLKKLITKVKETGNQILLRTAYGNTYKIGGTQRQDVKARNSRQFISMKSVVDAISTENDYVKRNRFRSFITKEFVPKSKYEKRVDINGF